MTAHLPAAFGPPVVLFEDRDLLAVAKPAGICTIPARDLSEPSLRRILEAERRETLFVVHRIDRETSGIVVFARNAESHRRLNDAFASRDVLKAYLALTSPVPAPTRGVIDVALHAARKGRMRPATPDEPESLRALTRYRVTRTAGALPAAPVALVELRPETGRQHQIRVHLRFIGAPVLGDPIYASAPVRALAPRLMLHAGALGFAHPRTGASVDLVLAPPADFQDVMATWSDWVDVAPA